MARFSQSTLSYTDVHQALEKAGQLGGLILTFDTPAEAVTWNGRANAYRVLLRKQNQAAGREFASEFDHLVISRKAGIPEVRIRPRGFGFKATAPDGTPVEFSKQTLTEPVLTPFERTQLEADADAFLEQYEAENRGDKK